MVCVTGFVALLNSVASNGLGAPAAQRGVHVVHHGSYPELQVDGKPFFPYSAEFFYPRLPRSLWESSLERYRELGINTITLSIPWNWHEPREGELDFDGHTNARRDLRGLLKLITEKGFKLIAHPGPTVAGEWRNGGYPDWLLERPEFHMPMADRLEGRKPPAAELAGVDAEAAAHMWLGNPVHMNYVAKWLETVAQELAPYRAEVTVRVPAEESAGAKAHVAEREIAGPLLFVHVEDGLGSGYANPAGAEFWKYVATLCGAVARAGADAPCIIDSAQPRIAAADSVPEQPVTAMGHWFFGPGGAGTEVDRWISPANAADLELTVASLAMQPDFPPALAEFNAAWFAPENDARPEITPPESIRMSSHLLAGYGLRGLSWFPLQDSLTPGGYGTPDANRFYRWEAGLGLNGSKQPAAREVQRMGDWLRAWGSQLAASHRRADFGLVDSLAALPAGQLEAADIAAVTHTIGQLERLAQYAGLSSELVDPDNQPSGQLLRHPLLLLPVYKAKDPAYALTARAQRALDAYVRGGGVLVCFPGDPAGAVFEQMRAGAPAGSDPWPEGTKAWHVGAGRFVVLTKDFYSWVSLDEDFEEGMKRFEAPFARSLLEDVLKASGVRRSIRRENSKPEAAELVVSELVSNEGTLPLGDRSGGEGWLSVVNLSYETAVTETLQLLSPRASARTEKDASDDWIDVPLKVPPRESLLLPVDVGLCLEPGVRTECKDSVVSSGAELVRAEREGKTMILSFYAPAKATVRLHLAARPEHIEVDEVQVNGQWLKPSHELVVELLRGASPQFLHELRLPMPYQPALPERPKPEGRHPAPAHFRFSPAGAVRLPLGEDTTLLTNPPLFVFRRGDEGSLWVVAENQGGQGSSVQVQATGQFNTSARSYVNGNELRSLNLKLPATAVEKAAAEAPGADGLYHGTLHFAAGAESQELSVAYLILAEKGTAGYQFDFDADGNAESALENRAVRAIFSPSEGGRMVALVAKSSERDLTSTMGLLEDVFTFTPDPQGSPRERMHGRAGTFNRLYSAEWVPGADGPALRLQYDAPDVYPHGARIEKTARFTGDETLAVEYRVSLLPAGARRLEDEAAGRIFAAPLPKGPVPQSFAILNSVPAAVVWTRATQFCWRIAEAGTTSEGTEHCEAFVPGGAAVSPPPGVRKIEIRDARRPGLAVAWDDAGARLTLEPKKYSVLLRLEFPPLDPGGATAAYRIEFSVREGP